MRIRSENYLQVHLSLSEVEAKILKRMVQNSIMDREPSDIKDFRYNLWNLLDQEGIQIP